MAVIVVTLGRVRASMLVDLDAAVVPPKRHEQQTEHVKRSDESGNQADQPINPVRLISLPENLIFAPEACERPDPCDGECRDEHGPKCHWNVRAQAAHLAHVLLAADG